MMDNLSRKVFCCNPFKKQQHWKKSASDLRSVSSAMLEKFPELDAKDKICSQCRKEIYKMRSYDSQPSTSSSSIVESGRLGLEETPIHMEPDIVSTEDTNDELFYDKELILNSWNECLNLLGEESFDKKRKGDKGYAQRKLEGFVKKISEVVFGFLYESDKEEHNESEILENIRATCAQSDNTEKKLFMLSLLPKNWPVNKIMSEFPNVSQRLARKSKEFSNNPQEFREAGKPRSLSISSVCKDAVKIFYSNDEVSRLMPGKKDYVSLKVGGVKMHVQKRLILGNLKEIYKQFKDSHPEITIGFSTFASLRPRNCILAGASGTHCVCVCIIHQNVKLMTEYSGIKMWTKGKEIYIENWRTCIALMMCNPPQIDCFLRKCSDCPDNTHLRKLLEDIFEEQCVDSITYKKWTATDRCSLETVVQSSEDFTDTFISKLEILVHHSFIAEQQSSYLKHLKDSITPNEFLVLLDFSENYSFVLQDEVQAYHWSTTQCTIHPFGIYYREPETQQLENVNFVIISDCLHHNTSLVYIFQRHLIEYLKRKFKTIKKIYYYSDGSAAQYKNKKNFLNISMHQEDFGVPAEWHYFATAHARVFVTDLEEP